MSYQFLVLLVLLFGRSCICFQSYQQCLSRKYHKIQHPTNPSSPSSRTNNIRQQCAQQIGKHRQAITLHTDLFSGTYQSGSVEDGSVPNSNALDRSARSSITAREGKRQLLRRIQQRIIPSCPKLYCNVVGKRMSSIRGQIQQLLHRSRPRQESIAGSVVNRLNNHVVARAKPAILALLSIWMMRPSVVWAVVGGMGSKGPIVPLAR